MTEETTQQEDAALMELSLLKSRAKLMGITFSNNIGLDALKEKIEKKMAGEADDPVSDETVIAPNPLEPEARPMSLRDIIAQDAMKLVRLRITNLDPKKKDLPGEVFTLANEYLGTVRKYIPYGEVTEDGYHVPNCIYERLKARMFQNIRSVKERNGHIRVETNWVREFSLEVLPPLTEKELKQLATAQQAAANA